MLWQKAINRTDRKMFVNGHKAVGPWGLSSTKKEFDENFNVRFDENDGDRCLSYLFNGPCNNLFKINMLSVYYDIQKIWFDFCGHINHT